MTMFLMSLNEFGDVYAEFDNTDHPYLAKVCHGMLCDNYIIDAGSLLILHDPRIDSFGQHVDCYDGSHL